MVDNWLAGVYKRPARACFISDFDLTECNWPLDLPNWLSAAGSMIGTGLCCQALAELGDLVENGTFLSTHLLRHATRCAFDALVLKWDTSPIASASAEVSLASLRYRPMATECPTTSARLRVKSAAGVSPLGSSPY